MKTRRGESNDVVGELMRDLTPPPTPLLLGEGSPAPPSLAGKGAGGLGFPNSPTASSNSRLYKPSPPARTNEESRFFETCPSLRSRVNSGRFCLCSCGFNRQTREILNRSPLTPLKKGGTILLFNPPKAKIQNPSWQPWNNRLPSCIICPVRTVRSWERLFAIHQHILHFIREDISPNVTKEIDRK